MATTEIITWHGGTLQFNVPHNWQVVERRPDGVKLLHYRGATPDYSLIVSLNREGDGRLWAHLSVAAREIPSYELMRSVKDKFLGPDRKAVMVFPERRRHVNLHPTCLHLFCCLDGDPLPEFSGFLPGVPARTL